MKQNKELTFLPGPKKLNIKNYIIIIVPIVLLLLLITIIALIVTHNTSPSTKSKNYLEENDFNCNKNSCTKQINDYVYTFNYNDLTYYIDSSEYQVTISTGIPTLVIKNNEFICSYIKDNYEPFTLVDKTFTYNKQCEMYIQEVNEHINEYKNIIESSKIDVKDLEK